LLTVKYQNFILNEYLPGWGNSGAFSVDIDSLYTSSFVLPDFPLVENIPFASLCPGTDGRFGFAVCLLPSNYYGNFRGPMMDFSVAVLIIQHVGMIYGLPMILGIGCGLRCQPSTVPAMDQNR
jgi:hypothetical protein